MLLAMLCFLGGARAQQALPYSYGFENNDLDAEGWTTVYLGTANSSEFGINGDAKRTGNYGFRFSSYNRDNTTYDQYLISPELNTTSGVVFQFYYKASSTYSTETFKVGYSTTDAYIESFTFGDEISTTSTAWTQSEEYVFPAGTKYVAIYYYSNYQYRLYVDDFTFEAYSSCAKPSDLTVTTSITNDVKTATATWVGTADKYNIDINGTVTNNVTSPYTFNIELSTEYTVKVQADCGGGETSNWSKPFSFTTPDCLGGHTIEYTLNDSYGDSWNGASITVVEGCGNIVETLTVTGASNTGTLSLCGDYYEFIWNSGNYDSECSFTFTENGTTLFTKPSSISNGLVLYTIGTTTPKPTSLAAGTPGTNEVELSWTENGTATAWQICVNNDIDHLIDASKNPFTLTGLTADTEYSVMVRAFIDDATQSCWSVPVTFTTAEACPKPTNLAETNITTNSATLSWEGYNDSYVLRLRPWTPAGDDVLPTATMTTYTFDLSNYSGTGAVAIRHYDVKNMFRLIVDDIVVKNAGGTVVYSQDFEASGGYMPSEFSTIDLDGDGYEWGVVDNGQSYVNGYYGLSSASWISGVGALSPDNWIILSNIELGGSISFAARGQDPSFAAENFCVYVSADEDMEEINVETTSYTAVNLTPNTPYSWQVAGISGDEQSSFVGSIFKTKDDALIFATEGNWNELSNWTDAEGDPINALPTIDNRVRIEANATIPSGVIAYTKKANLNGGTITIEDGGQLKQNSTVDVILKKEIDAAHYYLIATPLTTTEITQIQDGWAHVNVLDGNYDLYAFDSTADLEWINDESSSNHSEFTSGNNENVLSNQRGYLYANESQTTLKYEGSTAWSSYQSVVTADVTYASSSDPFNGWKLIGNPFSCNGYVSYVDNDDNPLNATFYKMNAAGDGFEAYENGVVLAPGEGAFIKVSEDGTITFSSEVPASVPDGSIATEPLPLLPLHGLATNQNADPFTDVTFAAEGYATYYNSGYDVVLPTGMQAKIVTESASDGTLTYQTIDGNVVPKATAVMLQVAPATGTATQQKTIILAMPSAAAITQTNLLQGSDEETLTTGDTGDVFYMLSYGKNENANVIGWYWKNEDGSAFTNGAHKAWLALPKSSGAPFLGLPGWEDTTGIVPVGVNPEDGEWYTLQGLKIGKKPTTKGVYIHNGKKIVIK